MPQTPHQDPPRDPFQEAFQFIYSFPHEAQTNFWCRVLQLVPFDDPKVLSTLHRRLSPRQLLAFLELCQEPKYAVPLTPAGEEAGPRPPDPPPSQERMKQALAPRGRCPGGCGDAKGDCRSPGE